MGKKQLQEIFDEIIERYETAESYCIQDFQSSEDDYSHEDLIKDIKKYKKLFKETLSQI